MSNQSSTPLPFAPVKVKSEYDTVKVAPTHLFCDCGNTKKARILGIHAEWALWLQCSDEGCAKTWFICNQCSDSRTKITTLRSLRRHYRDLHEKKKITNELQGCKKRRCDEDRLFSFPLASDIEPTIDAIMEDNNGHPLRNTNNVVSDVSQVVATSRYDSVPDVRWIESAATTSLGFSNQVNESFFSYDLKDGEKGGMNYLVKRSLTQSDFKAEELRKIKLPNFHNNLHMQIAKLSFLLSKKDKDLLAEILSGVYSVGCEDGYVSCQEQINLDFNSLYYNDDLDVDVDFITKKVAKPFRMDSIVKSAHTWGIHIPVCGNNIRKYHTESKFAVIPNLPIPPIKSDVPGHAYLSIVDCTRDFLGHSQTGNIAAMPSSVCHFREDTTVKDTMESKQAFEVLDAAMKTPFCIEKHPLICFLMFWSDDFEPNSMSKAARGSAWIKTMTIATTKGNGNRVSNTYPIAIGKKGDSHDSVERKINQDLMRLRDGSVGPFYDGKARKQLYLFFDVFANLQDQPERRNSNYLTAGNGTYSARWGVSANHGELYNVLRCCSACLATISQRYAEKQWALPLPNCPNCLAWDVLRESPLARNSIPVDYPQFPRCNMTRTISLDNGEMFLRPFRISYNSLEAAVDFAHDNFCNHGWSTKNCEAYLRIEGLNPEIIKVFMEHAVNAASLTLGCSEAQRQVINVEAARNPDKFARMPYPALWSRPGVELATHLDVIMHMLFLGVVKSTINLIKKWLTTLNKNSTFTEENAPYLESFKKMSLDWLRILPYGSGKLGGWVSENYLGFSRIFLWFYQNIEEATTINKDIPPPNLPQKKWLVSHNRYWLRTRGLDTEGLAAELSKRVADFMKQDPVPEPLPVPERHSDDVFKTLTSLQEVLKCTMAATVNGSTIQQLEYAIRIFLSHFDYLESTIRKDSSDGKKDKGPAVVSKYNFCCLMNLPEVMRKYGPLRDLWEGGPRGEGYLLHTKPHMTQGFRPNWHQNLLRRILREKAFDNILGNSNNKSFSKASSPDALKDRSRNFHIYQSTHEVTDLLMERDKKKKKAISVVLIGDKVRDVVRIFCVVGNHQSLHELFLDDQLENNQGQRNKFGQMYFHFVVKQEGTVNWTHDILPEAMEPSIGHAVLLPLLENAGDEENRLHCLVSSNWVHLQCAVGLQELVHNSYERSDGDLPASLGENVI